MSLLSVVNDAMDDIGYPRVGTNLFSLTTNDAYQVLALLRRAGQVLLQDYDWSGLITSGSITTIASTASYAMPADFDRLVDDTLWNQTNRVPLFGPTNQPDWAQVEFGQINTGPFYKQQLRGSTLYLQPTPTSVQTIPFYYISNKWIFAAGGATLGTTFTADTDTFVFPEVVLTAALKWRWLRAKRMSYDEEKAEYESMLIGAESTDRGNRVLAMDPAQEPAGIKFGYVVPLTGYGQ